MRFLHPFLKHLTHNRSIILYVTFLVEPPFKPLKTSDGAASSQKHLVMLFAEEMLFYGEDLLFQIGIWRHFIKQRANHHSHTRMPLPRLFSLFCFSDLPCLPLNICAPHTLRTTAVTDRTDLTVPFVFLRTVAAKSCVTPTRLMPSTSTI